MSIHTGTTCPDEVLASIAWYPDELDEARRGLVEAHLAQCIDCREELAFVKGEAEPPLAASDLPDADAVYARLMERIERAGTREARPGAPGALARRRPRRGTARGAHAAALAAGIVLAVLLGALGGMWLVASPPVPGPTCSTSPER